MTPRPGHSHQGGVEIRFWEWPGEPPPTLLLHGIGNYGRYWDLFARAIDGRLRLVAPDARGHGDSGKPKDGYAPNDFVRDALAVLDTLAIERAVVVGHSMGGTHALRLAADHPVRVIALALVDVGPEVMREGSERARRLTLARPERFADREEALAYLRTTSPGYTDEVYANRLEWALREDRAATRGAGVSERNTGLVWRSSSAALARIMSSRSAPDELWAKLREVRCPLLIVRGTRSNVLAAETAERMRRERTASPPSVRTELLELDAGHNVALDRPAELAEAVVRLARIPAREPFAASPDRDPGALPFVEIRGYRFGLFVSEPPHERAHVHVKGKGGSAKLWLRPVRLVRSSYSAGETSEIVDIVREHESRFLEMWREQFGDR